MAEKEVVVVTNWREPEAVLLSTPHGSHLYGLAHAASDRDLFVVHPVAAPRVKQTISGADDVLEMNFAAFLEYAARGSHQALEAMFSRQATVDKFPALRAAFHVGGRAVTNSYLGEARTFAFRPSRKVRRHALRLLLNLRDLQRYGRFDPTLSARQIALLNEATNEGAEPDARYLEVFQELAPHEVQF